MKAKRIMWSICTLTLLLFFMNGCKVFKKSKCDCPKFNYVEPVQPPEQWAKIESQEFVLGRDGTYKEKQFSH